jgi:hypothetical protein
VVDERKRNRESARFGKAVGVKRGEEKARQKRKHHKEMDNFKKSRKENNRLDDDAESKLDDVLSGKSGVFAKKDSTKGGGKKKGKGKGKGGKGVSKGEGKGKGKGGKGASKGEGKGKGKGKGGGKKGAGKKGGGKKGGKGKGKGKGVRK